MDAVQQALASIADHQAIIDEIDHDARERARAHHEEIVVARERLFTTCSHERVIVGPSGSSINGWIAPKRLCLVCGLEEQHASGQCLPRDGDARVRRVDEQEYRTTTPEAGRRVPHNWCHGNRYFPGHAAIATNGGFELAEGTRCCVEHDLAYAQERLGAEQRAAEHAEQERQEASERRMRETLTHSAARPDSLAGALTRRLPTP